MTKTQLIAAIAAVKKRLTAKPSFRRRETYCPAAGCIMPEYSSLPTSIPYNDLPKVTQKGFDYAASIGDSFYVRMDSRPGLWISLQDDPDRPTAKRLPHIITRVVDWQLLDTLRRAQDSVAPEEEDAEPTEYSAEDVQDWYETSFNIEDHVFTNEDAQVFEALYGIPATIEDPELGITRRLKLGDEFQIFVSPERDEINELDELYGEEPKDPRWDRREFDWSQQQDQPRYGKYPEAVLEQYKTAPFVAPKREPNEKQWDYETRVEQLKRTHFTCIRKTASVIKGKTYKKSVSLLTWPAQQVVPEGEAFIPIKDTLDQEGMGIDAAQAVSNKRKAKTKAQAEHDIAMAALPDNPPAKEPKTRKIRKAPTQPRLIRVREIVGNWRGRAIEYIEPFIPE